MAKLLLLLASGLASVTYAQVGNDPIAELAAHIPGGGVPGESYPILDVVPETGFLCTDQEFPGQYADTAVESRCQVFHVCHEDFSQDSFLCPNGTIFQQESFSCDWWFNVKCENSENFFGLNGVVPTTPIPNEQRGFDSVPSAPVGINRIAELAAHIPGGGVPGTDYPILDVIPETGFLCTDQEFPGQYADTAEESGCQVFHVCHEDLGQSSFLCPNGTIFKQESFLCDWWFNVKCELSEDFFKLNAPTTGAPSTSPAFF